MTNSRPTTVVQPSIALVIVFPPDVKGLFNPAVHALVRGVEERLEGVHVTYALTSGAAPDLEASLAAARFAGCTSAVVVHAEDWLVPRSVEIDGVDTVWSDPSAMADIRLGINSVVEAFVGARAAGVAA
jgi:hypothetical protein